MGKHTRTGHRSTGVAAAVAAGRPLRGRRRHAAPSAGTARRIAAPATLAALLLTTGATTGTAFAGTGSDDGSSGTSADCPDGSTPVGGSCSGGSSGSESSSGSSGGLGDLVTGADVVGSVLGAGGPGSGSSGGDSSDQGSGTTSETSGKDSGGKESGGEDSAGKDSAGEDSAGKDSGGSDSAAPAAGTTDSGSPSTGPLDTVPGLGDLTDGLGKGVDLNTPTKPLTSLPDPAQTLSDAGTSVPGAGQAGSLVDTAVGAAGTGLIALLNRGLTRKTLVQSFYATARNTAMIFFIVLGAAFYNGFLALTQVPQASTRCRALSSSTSGIGRLCASKVRGAVCTMARLVRCAIEFTPLGPGGGQSNVIFSNKRSFFVVCALGTRHLAWE